MSAIIVDQMQLSSSQNSVKMPKPIDMTIHWKALEQHFLWLVTVLIIIIIII
jgi:hypothetical protein